MKKQTHIIIFRLSAMGDVAMTAPVLYHFIKQHPEAKITFVSRPFLRPVFHHLESVSFFDVDTRNIHKGFVGLFRLFKELNALNPTHFADFHNVLRSKIVRSFFKFFTSVSVASIDKGRKEKRALTRKKNKVFKPLKTSHQRYADVLEKLGFPVDISNEYTITKTPLLLENKKITGEKNRPWVGIAPFAAFDSKTYPLDLMTKAIQQLSNENIQIFLFGGKADHEKLNGIAKQFTNVTSLAGQLNGLANELNIIQQLDVMLSMDSGNAHFAAMFNIKTITVWGNTHPYAGFAPYRQPNDFCVLPNLNKYPDVPCSIYGNKTYPGYEDVMRSIPPETIVSKILEHI